MSKVDEERLRKALDLCNLKMTGSAHEELLVRLSNAPSKGSYNVETGEITYAEGMEDDEEIQCLKRTLASKPEDSA